MKNRVIPSLLGLLLLALPLNAQNSSGNETAAKKAEASAIEGVWERSQQGRKGLKFIQNGKWTITWCDAAGKVEYHHGGSYTFDGKKYEETVEYAAESTSSLIGDKYTFEMSVAGDVLHQKGINNPYTEDWKRAKISTGK
jgi:hypothetical protein